MPTKTLRWHSASVQVTVPSGITRRIFGRRNDGPSTAAVRYMDPPPVPNTRQRRLAEALSAKEVAEDKGRQQLEEAGLSAASGGLAAEVASTSWYHTLELPGGITTPGQFDHRPLLPRYGLPTSMAGLRALDVATFNGFWAFEMERRGASVVGIDVDDPKQWDYPKAVKEMVGSRDMGRIGTGFEIAQRALESHVERRAVSVYDLTPESVGTFDFVHSGDVLLHLRNPLAALEAMRSVTRGEVLISDVIDVELQQGSFGPTLQYMGGWDDLLWWVPSLDSLAQMVVDAGFRDIRVNCVYNLTKAYEDIGVWRVSMSASG